MNDKFDLNQQIGSFYRVVLLLKKHGQEVRPIHHSMYFALLSIWYENNNGSKWHEINRVDLLKRSMVSNNTYYKTLNELNAWGLIEQLNADKPRSPRLVCMTDLTKNPSRVVRRAIFGKY